MAQSPANIDLASRGARTGASPPPRHSTTAFRSRAGRMDAPETTVTAGLAVRLRRVSSLAISPLLAGRQVGIGGNRLTACS
jgi:hypothetical protein